MARFILLTVVAFVAITFVSLALKGVLRRFIGGTVSSTGKKGNEQDKRILHKKDDVVVLQGNAKENTTST